MGTMSQEDYAHLVPPLLKTPKFLMAWEQWVADRKERRLKLTERAARMHLKHLAEYDESTAIKAIELAIAKGYRMPFVPKQFQKRRDPDLMDEQQRREQSAAAARHRAAARIADDHRQRIERVRQLSQAERERIKQHFIDQAANHIDRASLMRADPLGGGRLTALIYAYVVAREMGK